MKQNTIVFPTDFSHASDAVLLHAESLAKQQDAELLIVHVEEPPLAYGGGELYYGIPEPSSGHILAMLERVTPTEKSLTFTRLLLLGDPASEIVRIADERKADMIVLGTHGRTGLTRMLMGSVAESIVRRAPCPVLVYRETNEQLTARKPSSTP